MWRYNYTDELCHYGIPGMRWGHRKSVKSAYKDYKNAKKEVRREKFKSIKNVFKKSSYVAGVKNSAQNAKNRKPLNDAIAKREKAAFKVIDSKAKEAYDKKLAKTGSKSKAQAASMKVHYKAFKKDTYGSGRVGSAADNASHKNVVNGNKHYYNHLAATKGKKYADVIEKKYNRKTTRDVIGSGAALVGLSIATAYLKNKH